MERKKEGFAPCKHCSNILKNECFEDCFHVGDFNHFKLKPGIGIKDLPNFPMDEVINDHDPKFRLLVVSIYLAAITDYLQHEEEYEFREKAPDLPSILPKNFRLKV